MASASPYAPLPPPRRQGFAIASLILGVLSLPTAGLLFIGAMVSIILGVVALVKASREPALYGGKGMAIAGLVLSAISIVVIPFIGIIAAIVIPSLLRARVAANEAAAIGDTRTVISAEAAYQDANAGYFDTIECLGTPGRCIPGFTGSAFLPDGLAHGEVVTNGYRRRFHPGPTAQPTPPKASPTSLMAFAYTASPAVRGKTGVRAFCGDSTGRICYVMTGEEPEVEAGVCAASCRSF